MMYQAKRGHAPLVVIAGNAGIQYNVMDAQMAIDLIPICSTYDFSEVFPELKTVFQSNAKVILITN